MVVKFWRGGRNSTGEAKRPLHHYCRLLGGGLERGFAQPVQVLSGLRQLSGLHHFLAKPFAVVRWSLEAKEPARVSYECAAALTTNPMLVVVYRPIRLRHTNASCRVHLCFLPRSGRLDERQLDVQDLLHLAGDRRLQQ